MPYTVVRGINLYYEEYGAGPPVIVAHGALGSIGFADEFGLKASALAARGLHVIAYDARGHGRSGHTTAAADYEKASLAADLLGLMDALGLARASICGTSMGATTALLLALEHPERVERLVLRSPAPFGDDMIPARRTLRGLAWSYQAFGVALTARFAAMMPGTGDPARTRALLRHQRREAIVPALRGFLAGPLDTQRLDEVASSTLVLAHGGDSLHPLRSGDVLYERMPHAALCIAPSATFWHNHEQALTDMIGAFLRGDETGPDSCSTARGCLFKPTRSRLHPGVAGSGLSAASGGAGR